MKTILEYLRLTLFVGGALIGVQVPGFVDLYGQKLESHMLESKISLNGFQGDADKYFNGSLEALVAHYEANRDPIVRDGASNIDELYSRARLLQQAWSEFNESSYHRYWHVCSRPIISIREEAWQSYGFSVKLDLNGIGWALGFGLLISILVELLLFALSVLFRLRAGKTISHEPQ